MFGYENELVIPIYVSDQKFKDSMDLLLLIVCCLLLLMVINHVMCTLKILTDLCFTKQKIKTKNGSVKVVYNVLDHVLTKNKEDCLSINGKQSVKLEKGIIEFEN